MNNKSTVQLTQEGYDQLKAGLEALIADKRPRVVERLSHARSMGDLAENSDYHSAKEELEFVDGKIEELQTILGKANVVKGKNGKKTLVDVGCKVKVGINGAKHVFNIVGEWEADPRQKKISHKSPLGKSLMGKKVGEKVEVEAPAGKVHYTILAIE